ncbi:hypothetical protein Tco_1278701 [Tanacetum coccineum]
MMYERPPTTPFQNPSRNTTFLYQRYTLVFQQYRDEPIYDAWTRFKNLIKRVPHHGLDLWSLTQFFYDHVDDYTQMDLDFAADGNLRELSGEEAWETIENFAQGQKEWDNPPNINSEQEIENLKETTPPVTHPEEVDETLETPIEVEPLDETQLEDLGMNTRNHDIPLSSREVPSSDEPEPQSQPLPSCPSLDVNLREKRGTDPPIKPHSLDSFRIKEMFDDDWELESKEVSSLGEELSLFDKPNEVERSRILEAHRLEPILQQLIFQHVTPSHNNGVYRYYHPYLNSSIEEPSPLSVK